VCLAYKIVSQTHLENKEKHKKEGICLLYWINWFAYWIWYDAWYKNEWNCLEKVYASYKLRIVVVLSLIARFVVPLSLSLSLSLNVKNKCNFIFATDAAKHWRSPHHPPLRWKTYIALFVKRNTNLLLFFFLFFFFFFFFCFFF